MVQFKGTALATLAAMTTLLSTGVNGATYILSDDRVRSLDATPVLGRGYSIMTNSFQSTCLDIDVTSVPSYNYDYTWTDFTQSDDLEAEVAGSISNTFGYYYVKEQIENELSRNVTDGFYKHDVKYHVVATMRVERFYSSVREEVSPLVISANTLLDKQDYVGFFKACGPNYVRSIRRAQEVTAVFSYFSSSLELAQEFATGLKTSNTFSATADFKEFTKAKFDPITSSLEINVLGFGLGLDQQGSGSLVAPTLDDYNEVMQFAFNAMTQSDGSNSRNIGQVYGIEVAPWVDNVNFQIASKLHEESIEIPLPRSLLAMAFTIDGSATAFDNNSTATRALFRCKDPSYRIDMYGYCCEREALYVPSELRYDYSDPTIAICRPIRNLDKAIVTNNMNANAEFVTRLDVAVQRRFNQIGTLEKCVSATRMIPSKWDDYYLKPQGSVKYDKDFEGQFSLASLRNAVDPNGDYGLVNHMGDELDEWMDMYYQPCLAALYGKNVGVSSDVEVAYFMSYPWHTHEECTRLACLSDSMRWDRTEQTCSASLIAGKDAATYSANPPYCSFDLESSPTEECKYDTSDLMNYYTNVTGEWAATPTLGSAVSNYRIDSVMDYYCMPVVTGKKFYVNGPGGP